MANDQKQECEFCGGAGCAACGAASVRQLVGLDGGRGGGEDYDAQMERQNETSFEKSRRSVIIKAQAGLKELIGAIWTTLDDIQDPEEYDLVGECFQGLLEDISVYRSLGGGDRKRSRSDPEVPTWEPQADLFDPEKADECFAEIE